MHDGVREHIPVVLEVQFLINPPQSLHSNISTAYTNSTEMLSVRNERAPFLRYYMDMVSADEPLYLALDSCADTSTYHHVVTDVDTVSTSLIGRTAANALGTRLGTATLGDTAAMVAHALALGVVILALGSVPFVRVSVVVTGRTGLGLDVPSVLVVPCPAVVS